MKRDAVLAAYRRYARFYDLLFGGVLAPGRRMALETLQARASERVLEIGVGTGLALPLYDSGVVLTGVDLSAEMLGVARKRALRLGREFQLLEMDAQAMSFPEASFDACIAMYVVSVAPDPAALIREMKRVTRPGGRLVVVNHFSRHGGRMESAERALAPLAGRVGFEPLFYLDEFIKLAGIPDPRVQDVPPYGYWKVLSWTHPGS